MAEAVKLKRQLGLIHGVAVMCGLVIGSGIYIAPKGVLMYLPSVGVSLILWSSGGILATLGALSFAELGTTFPSSGEKYHYLEKMYGPFLAFIYLWMYLLMFRPAANAVKCLVFAQYVLQPAFPDCEVPKTAVILIAICLASLLTAVNCFNVKASAIGQTFMTSMGLSALVIICISGLVYIAGNGEHLQDPFAGASTNVGDAILAAYYGIFAYWGWNALNFMVEELKDPYRNLPRAIYISMALITLLYVTVNVSYMGVLGVDGVLASDAVAVSLAQKTLGKMAWIIPILIAVNTAGSFNSGSLVGSRLCFVGARRGHLPDILALINIRVYTPITALIFQLILAIVMMTTVDIYTLYNNVVFSNTLFDGINVAGMLWFRYKRPDLHRPIKMPIVIPVIFLLCMTCLTVIPLVIRPTDTAVGLLIILCTGVPYYVVFVLWQNKPSSFTEWTAKRTIEVQKLLYSAKQEDTTS